MEKTVLVTGASSQLGIFLLPRLQAAGFRVLAFSRKAPAVPFDVSDSVRWMQAGQAVAAATEIKPLYLVSCGPLAFSHALVEACRELRQVVAFSTSSILTKADSENHAENELIANIVRDEQRLGSLCRERGVPLALIRPTLIYGCGLDRNISSMARFGRRFGFIPVAGNSAGLRQPVHAEDLSALAVNCLASKLPVSLESVACGGSTLSYREMMEKTAAACGPGVRILALNSGMLTAAVRLVSVLPAYRGMNTEMVRRQALDMIFDDTVLREKLGYQPRPFDPQPGDFAIPPYARELQLPG